MTKDLDSAVSALLAHVGAQAIDVNDEHERWSLYQAAMGLPQAWQALEEAVRLERDDAVATSVVLQMLSRSPADGRERWVRALSSAEKRKFARRRADELGVLEAAAAGEQVQPANWSRWLQERLAEQATDAGVLAYLARDGDTKRVRRAAAERLRVMRSAGGSS
jgi:hypothetical protein